METEKDTDTTAVIRLGENLEVIKILPIYY